MEEEFVIYRTETELLISRGNEVVSFILKDGSVYHALSDIDSYCSRTTPSRKWDLIPLLSFLVITGRSPREIWEEGLKLAKGTKPKILRRRVNDDSK